MAADFMRIGDAERDEAVRMLQEHHATGRLSSEEFDDRMSRALQARTMSELTALFVDLPEPKPSSAPPRYGAPPGPQPVTSPVPTYGYDYDQAPAIYDDPQPSPMSTKHQRPWYAQWWMIFVAVGVTIMVDSAFPIILLTALWIWVVYPAVFENRRYKEVAPPTVGPTRPLTYSEREWVMEEVRSGHKMLAIKRYRELTGADLRTAKQTIDSWSRQIGR